METSKNANLLRAAALLRWSLLSVAFMVVVGCPTNSDIAFDGHLDRIGEEEPLAPAPIIESVRPPKGPTTGGTVVEVLGENFQRGAKVYFATSEAVEVNYRNPTLLVAITPPGEAGPVTVQVVNPDGQIAQLAGGFTYIEVQEITWCSFDRPASVSMLEGGESPPLFGRVESPGYTDGTGQGTGIVAQLGFGLQGTDPTGDGWRWVDAFYSGDVDGPSEGDLRRDEYRGTLTIGAAGSYNAAFRFSVDGGASWVVCDMDPSDFPTYLPQDAASLQVMALPDEIDHCILSSPASMTAAPGAETPPVVGRVRILGFTDVTSGELTFVRAQAGLGPDGDDPAVSSRWSWKDAAFDSDSGSDDQYRTTLTSPTAAGRYDYAFRFSINGGATWTYCDRGGSNDGYSVSDAGDLLVEEPPEVVDWCNTQWPTTTWTGPGFPTDPIYGRVAKFGTTDGPGQGAGIEAQVGWGPRGSDPIADGGWRWIEAPYFGDARYAAPRDADEYAASLHLTAPGDYSFAYRFSADGGRNWTFCDLNGSADGFQTDRTGYLRVVLTTVTIEWCNTQHPPATTVSIGGETEMIYGQVFSSSGATSSPGRSFNIIAEVGFGPDGSNLPAEAARWTWKRANFNVDFGNNDEFMATIGGFPAPGSYDYAYRFTGDWGGSWVYCDLDGSTNGYSPLQAGTLTVTSP